jgi:hypothetical protein
VRCGLLILPGAPEFAVDIKRLEITSPAAFCFSKLLRDFCGTPPDAPSPQLRSGSKRENQYDRLVRR